MIQNKKYWNEGPLHVMKEGKYFANGNTPFFWLGDTAWLLFQECSLEDAYQYLRNRQEKGFNVIQATLIHTVSEGADAFEKRINCSEYWEHCVKIVEMAEEMNLYMGLLPTWGSLVKNKILTPHNVENYGEFLSEKFARFKNIIWLLGGDIRGDESPETYVKLAKVLKKNNPERLVTFHPFGRTTSAFWFHDSDWLDFNMFQSGHRRYDQASLGEWDDNADSESFYGEDSWRYVRRDLSRELKKPVLDGEPSYEGILQGLHVKSEPYWEAWDARRFAYWSVLEGAAGHTYGNNAVMQFYHDIEKPGAYGVRETWRQAIHNEGSNEMKHLRELMERVPFTEGRPAENQLVAGQKERYHRICVFAGKEFIICYDYCGSEFEIDIRDYKHLKMDAYWMSPVDGVYSYIRTVTGEDRFHAAPLSRKEKSNDWVLLLITKEKHF